MKEEQYYIYKTTNLINGKQYIGKHKGLLDDDYLGSGSLVTKAINKYGQDNFKKEILCICKDETENREKEKYFINYYNAIEDPNFYNIAEGGQGGFVTAGYTKEQRLKVNAKISKANSKENHPMFGKHIKPETKEKISKSLKEYWTEEKRQEQSEKMKGENNPMYGRHQSAESTAKRIAHTDFSSYRTIEYKQKMSDATKGEKNGNYGNKGEKAKNGKSVSMYDKNYNLIKVFNTKRMALEFLGIQNHNGIDNAIRQGSLYKGYYWKQD